MSEAGVPLAEFMRWYGELAIQLKIAEAEIARLEAELQEMRKPSENPRPVRAAR